MTDNRQDETTEPRADDGPGSDPGSAYRRSVEGGEAPTPDEEDEEGTGGPNVGDVYRSGS